MPTSPADTSASSDSLTIAEIEIRSTRAAALSSRAGGTLYWQMSDLQELPQLLGTADPMRMLQALPGITTQNDFASGLCIQGCETGHNMMLIDGAQVFNPSHLLGIFSTLNASHFRGMEVTKNAHSALTPNRIGGVVRAVSGDSIVSRVHLDGTVSVMHAQGTLTVPAGQRTTLRLSARRSYLNLLYGSLLSTDDYTLRYGMQDYNLGLVHKVNERHSLKWSAYYGSDDLSIDDVQARWHNAAASLRHEGSLSWASIDQTLALSHYKSTFEVSMAGAMQFSEESSISNVSYRGSLSSEVGSGWRLTCGIESQLWHALPLDGKTKGTYMAAPPVASEQTAGEGALAIEADWQVSRALRVSSGLRASAYIIRGVRYGALDPRLTFVWQPTERQRLTLHAGIYHQYVHQTRISSGGLPIDYHSLSTAGQKAEWAESASLGYRAEIGRAWAIEAELWCKRLHHCTWHSGTLTDLFTATYDREGSLISGRGRNYGVSLMLQRTRGKVQGWLSYALSWAERKQAGAWFNADDDRRHDLTGVANWQLNKHLSLSGQLTYATGLPFTRPVAFYVFNGNLVSLYGEKNGARLPDLFRIDLSATWHLNNPQHSLNLSLYNVTMHKNVLMEYRMMAKEQEYYTYQIKSIARLLPSISYRYCF